MIRFQNVLSRLIARPEVWLVTGAAGFIGSNVVERLLEAGQTVRGLDNFSTGKARNLEQVRLRLGPLAWSRFSFLEGDIRDLLTCRGMCRGVDVVLHHAALGSVLRSIEDPIATNETNVEGFLNMLVAARDSEVRRFVYAASSSTYGDDPGLPKVEERVGNPLSPYAVTKYVNELYARVFQSVYGVETVGLRYFNVFGPRQDPHGAYAAVIPRWIQAMLSGEPCVIHGDGETSRDFCYVDNVVQANLLAGAVEDPRAVGEVYNVACGERTTLNSLFEIIRDHLAQIRPQLANTTAEYRPFRSGDVRHSHADISKIGALLGYVPTHTVRAGLGIAVPWYARSFESPVIGAPAETPARVPDTVTMPGITMR